MIEIILKGISILTVCGSIVYLLWRMLGNAGVPWKNRDGLPASPMEVRYTPGKKECAAVFACAMLFRVFMVAIGFVIFCLFVDAGSTFQWDQFFGQWIKWDATSYVKIPDGYRSLQENGNYVMLVFFPLYSWALKLVHIVIPNINAAALLTSAVCYATGCVFLYKLCCMDYSRETARKAVVLISISPFAFFYGAIMTEGMFLMTSVLTLYFIRRHDWVLAGLFGMFAALSRSVGVFLIFPATVEFLETYRPFDHFDVKETLMLVLKKWSWLLLMPAGTCIYLYINYRVAGNPLEFLRLEELVWNQKTTLFFETPANLWDFAQGGYATSTKISVFIPGLLSLLAVYAILVAGLKKSRTMLSVWLVVYVIVNTSMSWPISLGRYLACAVPAFITLGDLCVRNRKLDLAVTIGFALLMGIYFTGYLTGKQIM